MDRAQDGNEVCDLGVAGEPELRDCLSSRLLAIRSRYLLSSFACGVRIPFISFLFIGVTTGSRKDLGSRSGCRSVVGTIGSRKGLGLGAGCWFIELYMADYT